MSQNVSIDEAARLLGVSQDTVRRRIRNGELEAHQVARPQGYTWRVEFPDEPANEECDGAVTFTNKDLPYHIEGILGCDNNVSDAPYHDLFYEFQKWRLHIRHVRQ